MIYGYYRVSTDRQDFENQKTGVLSFCKRNEFKIDKEYIDDGVSGTTEPSHRKLGCLLKRLQRGDILICSEISRLGRKMLMVMDILNLCMKKGCSVYTVKDGFRLDNSINSQILAFAFSLSAQIERELISARTREAMARCKMLGIKIGRPKGYHFSKLDGLENKIYHWFSVGKTKADIARKCHCTWKTLNDFGKEKHFWI